MTKYTQDLVVGDKISFFAKDVYEITEVKPVGGDNYAISYRSLTSNQSGKFLQMVNSIFEMVN
jgi:hypothetical protein